MAQLRRPQVPGRPRRGASCVSVQSRTEHGSAGFSRNLLARASETCSCAGCTVGPFASSAVPYFCFMFEESYTLRSGQTVDQPRKTRNQMRGNEFVIFFFCDTFTIYVTSCFIRTAEAGSLLCKCTQLDETFCENMFEADNKYLYMFYLSTY